jgi:purine-binding chemotaxis protein CheW
MASAFGRSLLVFRIDDRRYALDMAVVLRALRMMEVSPLPDAPGVVSGIINVAGRLVPVMNLRHRFGIPERESLLSDVLVLAQTRALTVALPADSIDGLVVRDPNEVVPGEAIVPGMVHVAGVVKLEDGLVMIQDLDAFLSLPERRDLERALGSRGVAA